MIQDNSAGYIEEYDEINPLLTNTAIGLELGGGLAGWLMGKQGKKLDLRAKAASVRAGHAKRIADIPFERWINTGNEVYAEGYVNKGIDPKLHKRATSAYKKNRAISRVQGRSASRFSAAGSRYKRLAKTLGIVSIAALGYEMGQGLFSIADSFADSRAALNTAMVPSYQDTSYYDSRRAMTQRQRAIQAIHSSQLSTRMAFGQESSYLHQ